MTGTPNTDGGRGDGFAPPPGLAPFAREAGDLFLYDVGNGPPLLLLHGNGDEADTWRQVLPELANTWRVIAPDLPGFGRSKPMGTGQISDLADAVAELLKALDLRDVQVVGSSMGGAVAAEVAARARDRVAGLTLVGGGPAGHFGEGGSPLAEPGVGEAFYNGLRDQGQAAAYGTLTPFYANLAALPEADRAFLRERVWARVWSDTQRDAFLGGIRSLFTTPALDLARLDGLPVHLIWGERDAIVPLALAERLRSALPQASLTVLPGVGHLPHQERPEAFLQALLAVLPA